MQTIALMLRALLFVSFISGACAIAQPPEGDVGAEPTDAWSQYDQFVDQARGAMMGDPTAALEHARQAEAFARSQEVSERQNTALITALWLQSEAMTRTNKPRDARPIAKRALRLFGEDPPATKLHGDLLVAQARSASALSDYGVALEGFQRAHAIFNDIGEDRSAAIALQSIGSIYNDAHQYDRSLEYYRRAAETYSNDPALDLSAANNQANALRELERYEEAMALYEQSMEIAEAFDSPMLNARIMTNIASLHIAMGDHVAAQELAEFALVSDSELESGDWSRFLWGVQAEAAHLRGDDAEALRLTQRVFDGVSLDETTHHYMQFHSAAVEIYEDAGDRAAALLHMRAFKRLDDESRDIAAAANVALLGAQFDFANQQLEIQRLESGQLERDIALAQLRARQHSLIAGVLAIGSVLLIGFGVFHYRSMTQSHRATQEANESLSASNRKLLETDNRLRRLVKEIGEARDQAEAANIAKSQFLANMSHELRTPLNAIINYAEMVEEDLEETHFEELKGDVAKIRSSGRHLLRLINEILDLSKIEAGRMEVDAHEFSLSAVVNEVVATVAPLANRNGNDLSSSLPQEEIYLHTDSHKLQQCLLNILSNACKFTENGSVALEVSVVSDDHTNVLEFCVSDTGIGMTEEQLSRLFDAFIQADASTTRQYGGTGLGLTITRHLSKLLEGELSVESVHGEGSTFRLRIPVRLSSQNENTPASLGVSAFQVPSNALDQARSNTVLVVDDDPSVLQHMSRMLSKQKFIVRTAASAEEGWAEAKCFAPDVIILDLHMDGMNGYDFLQKIKKDEDLSDTPVVINSIDDNIQQSLSLGAAVHLVKPATKDRLAEVLSDVCRQGRPNVLIVEADNDIRESLCRHALSHGLKPIAASSGSEAIVTMRANTFDAIILDFDLPDIGATEFLERVRTDARWADTSVFVMLAADVDDGTVDQVRALALSVFDKSEHALESMISEVAKYAEFAANERRESAAA